MMHIVTIRDVARLMNVDKCDYYLKNCIDVSKLELRKNYFAQLDFIN